MTAPDQRSISRRQRRSGGLQPVDSPYPAVEDASPHPSPVVRARGAVGMLVLVVIFGLLAALSVAVILIAAVLAGVTAIN